jgi:hypothetical protein
MDFWFRIFACAIFTMITMRAQSQQLKFQGTHPADTAVLSLMKKYSEVFEIANIKQRDAKRKTLVSEAYFYHGIDGNPISLEGLTTRQTKNGFEVLADSVFDETLYQYENSAILIFKEWKKGNDKGKSFESTRSVLIVMSRENGKWKILSDIIGQDPKKKSTSGK